MHIQQDFEQIIKHLYNAKIAVVASPNAKKILESKFLTPALFMRPFYQQNARLNFSVIDIEDFRKPNPNEYRQKAEALLSGPLMNKKISNKQHFDADTDVEDHINKQNFRWFLESSKLFLETTSYQYQHTTIDQPLGIIQILSAKDNFHKDYQIVNQQTNKLKRQSYFLNPTQNLKLQCLVIILIDKSNESTVEQALKYTDYLRKDCKLNGNLIHRLEVNSPEAGDMHSFWLPCVRNSYQYKQQLKPGEKIYLLSPIVFDKLKKDTMDHQEVIDAFVNARIGYLVKQFKQFSKTTNKIKGLFSTNNNKDKYNNDQQECRELADLYFLFGEYKKAYDCYNEILGKFSDRNKKIYFSISEMMTHCIVFSKKYGQWFKNGDVYSTFQKDSIAILEGSNFMKQAIFIVYGIYTLKKYKKQFIRDYFYHNVKAKQKDPNCQHIMSALLHEQIATFHLLYTPIEKRNYTNSLLKAGMMFSQNKLQLNAFHCWKIIENTYSQSFSMIERFIYTYLSKMCLQNSQFAAAVIYLRKGWNAIDNHISEDKYNQFMKNYEKLLNGIIEAKAENYLKQDLLPLRFPIIKNIELTLQDEICEQKISKMSIYNFNNPVIKEWTQMGEQYFGSDNVSMNANKEYFRKLASFDAQSIQKKQISHRVKIMIQNQQNIIKNTRTCFVNEQIKIQVYIYNPLFKEIELNDCKVVIFGTDQQPSAKFIFSDPVNTKIKPASQKMIQFTVTPLQSGLYELSKFTWYFNKLFNEFELPKYKRKTERNYYFKFNVNPQVGKLRIVPKIDDQVSFVGMIDNIAVRLVNDGKEQIEDITLIVSDPRLFGFRRKDFKKIIQPDETLLEKLPIRIYSPDLVSIRCLFIYRSAGLIRLKRLIVPLATTTVVEIKNLSCEKLSSHIHLLNFSVQKMHVEKQLNKSVNLLNDDAHEEFRLLEMILGHGFQIIKVESTKSGNKTAYTFFLQKNPHALSQRNLFTNLEAQNPALYEAFCKIDQEHRMKEWDEYENKSYPYDHHERMTILFIFEYEGKKGIIHPQRVSTNPKLLKILDKQSRLQDFLLPFDFKAKYPAIVSNNFSTNPVLEIDVEFRIKNIFTEKPMDIGIEFIDGDLKLSPNDQLLGGSWQGQVSYRIELQKDKEAVFQLKFVVFENGIFDMSKIRYKLFKEKAKSPITIMHSQFEKLFIQVVNGTVSKSQNEGTVDSSDLLG